MRELYFENGRKELFDDSYSNSINNGSRAIIYPYGDKLCLKLFLDAIRGLTNFDDNGRLLVPINDHKVEMLKRINDLNNPYIYKIDEFFKCEYEYASLNNGVTIIKQAGYTAEYIDHYYNDVTHTGKPCFNILTMSCDDLARYYNQMFDLILYLTRNNIRVNDLHRRNVVKGKDYFTLIDCDEYQIVNSDNLRHNLSELRKCFADIIAAGLYFTFDVGSDQEYTTNNLSSLYSSYVEKNLLNFKDFDIRNVFDFIEIMRRYSKPYEYFEEQFKLVKRK